MNAIATAIEQLHESAAASPGMRRFSDTEMASMMALAAVSYQRGDWQEAARAYGCLKVYRPLCDRILKAFAFAEMQLGRYQQAAGALGVAVLVCPHDVEALCFYGQCMIGLAAYEEAQAALLCAIEHADERSKYRAQAYALLQGIKNYVG